MQKFLVNFKLLIKEQAVGICMQKHTSNHSKSLEKTFSWNVTNCTCTVNKEPWYANDKLFRWTCPSHKKNWDMHEGPEINAKFDKGNKF